MPNSTDQPTKIGGTSRRSNPCEKSLMFKIDAIVTRSTRTELKLTAFWPLIWLRKPGYLGIERHLLPGEIVPPPNSFVERSEVPIDRGLLWNLQLGDRVLVQCILEGEYPELAMTMPDTTSGNVIDCQEFFQESSQKRLSQFEPAAGDQSLGRRQWAAPDSGKAPHPDLAGGTSTPVAYFFRSPQSS